MNPQLHNPASPAPLMMWASTSAEPEEVDPQELAALVTAVSRARRFATCLRSLVAAAVTTASVALGQDWSQEAAHLLSQEEKGPLTINR